MSPSCGISLSWGPPLPFYGTMRVWRAGATSGSSSLPYQRFCGWDGCSRRIRSGSRCPPALEFSLTQCVGIGKTEIITPQSGESQRKVGDNGFIWAVKCREVENPGERAEVGNLHPQRGHRIVQCCQAIFLLILVWHKSALGTSFDEPEACLSKYLENRICDTPLEPQHTGCVAEQPDFL